MNDHLNYNPDVLSCLANLSNDEVFTPPTLVNQILDSLPEDLFKNKKITFLDPSTKSGVFLREITKRLNKGLETQIPNQQERLNHILKNQVFGIAITELTSFLSRRSLYCSKKADSKYSIVTDFGTEKGNVLFNSIQHSWEKNRCKYCGASEDSLSRSNELESHAYEFVHSENPEEIFKMKFDVIVGNPPYQLSTGGSGVQAVPIYHKFIAQAKKLNPRYISMIIPSRWFSGGFGLDQFRNEMLNDKRLKEIHDYPEAMDVFPGVQIKGGVCYFLWDSSHDDDCKITTYRLGKKGTTVKRPLLEKGIDYFIRYNEAVNIYRKVSANNELTIDTIVSQQKPFGLATTFSPIKIKNKEDDVKVYGSTGIGYCSIKEITSNLESIKTPKVFIGAAGSGSDKFPHQILGVPFIPEINSVCTETYIYFSGLENEKQCKNLISYISTKFFRFLVMLIKPTQHALRKVYSLVPIQDFNETWTDEKLYKKYLISKEEIEFIDSMIKPMAAKNE